MFQANIDFFDFLKPFITSVPGGENAVFILFLAVSVPLSYMLSSFAIPLLSFLTKKTKTTLDDEILKRLKMPLFAFFSITAIYASVIAFYNEIRFFNLALSDAYFSAVLVIAAFTINRVIDALLIWYGKEISPARKDRKHEDIFPFVRNVLKIIIYFTFLAIILERIGIAVAPLLAGLGIAGLAVALALQDTLSNFFAGLHILADKPFREGDYIKLESGLEGTVDSIGWRSTKLRQAANNCVIIPNAKLAQNVIINLSMPNEMLSVAYELNIDYGEDADKVEEIILKALQKVQKEHPDLFRESEPWAGFGKFGDYALIFKYGYTVSSHALQFNALKETNKELFYAFRKSNIKILVRT